MFNKSIILIFLTTVLWWSCKDHKQVFTVDQNKVTVKEGTEFILKIASNHSTGYQWIIGTPIDTSILKLISTDYTITNKKLAGGGGYEYWHFKAVKKGENIVHLIYKRPWETNSEPSGEANFTVIVE